MNGDPEDPTRPLPAEPAEEPTVATRQLDRGSGDGRRLGFGVLAASILAAIALCGGYIALGELDYAPSGAADPCDSRPWGSPRGVEATAERFSLAAIDGAACELGVSREELTRALVGEESRNRFAEDHGLSENQIEDAVRAGLLRATDEAERGGSLGALAATGIRVAVKVMPMSVMIAVIDDAASLFDGSGGTLGGALGGALDLLDGPAGSGEPGAGGADEQGGGGSGTRDSLEPGDIPGRLGGALTDRLKQELPDDVRQALPEDLGRQVEKGLDSLINP